MWRQLKARLLDHFGTAGRRRWTHLLNHLFTLYRGDAHFPQVIQPPPTAAAATAGESSFWIAFAWAHAPCPLAPGARRPALVRKAHYCHSVNFFTCLAHVPYSIPMPRCYSWTPLRAIGSSTPDRLASWASGYNTTALSPGWLPPLPIPLPPIPPYPPVPAAWTPEELLPRMAAPIRWWAPGGMAHRNLQAYAEPCAVLKTADGLET